MKDQVRPVPVASVPSKVARPALASILALSTLLIGSAVSVACSSEAAAPSDDAGTDAGMDDAQVSGEVDAGIAEPVDPTTVPDGGLGGYVYVRASREPGGSLFSRGDALFLAPSQADEPLVKSFVDLDLYDGDVGNVAEGECGAYAPKRPTVERDVLARNAVLVGAPVTLSFGPTTFLLLEKSSDGTYLGSKTNIQPTRAMNVDLVGSARVPKTTFEAVADMPNLALRGYSPKQKNVAAAKDAPFVVNFTAFASDRFYALLPLSNVLCVFDSKKGTATLPVSVMGTVSGDVPLDFVAVRKKEAPFVVDGVARTVRIVTAQTYSLNLVVP
ncbi:MAG: hypothetical protein U0169_19870 [Polyangiaceae bacterium]